MTKKRSAYKRTLLASLILLVRCLPISADTNTTWYQVELIVFSHLNTQSLNSEQWPFKVHSNIPKAAVMLSPTNQHTVTNPTTTNDALLPPEVTTGSQQAFTLLPPKDFVMQKEAQTLNRRPGYQVILHIAWRQSIVPTDKVRPIHIYGGNAYNDEGKVVGFDPAELTPYFGQNYWQVNGTFTISVRRFLNVHLNLVFANPVPQLQKIAKTKYFDAAQSNLFYFRLLQSRRMRSNELNYIDYPIYGVLIKVVPIDHRPKQQ